MCGIAGVRGSDAPTDELRLMLDLLQHRGPNDEGFHQDGGMAIGMRRLSIIDVTGGHQPFASDDGRLALVGNGEIYNHVSLRRELVDRGHDFRSRSDIEVILHLYEEYAEDCFRRLRGMFAVAIADRDKGRLLLARDRLGIKPLYYSSQGSRFAFASEYRALVCLPWISRDPDIQALNEFAAWGWTAPPRTALVDVRKVAPGQLVTVDDHGVREASWWSRRYPTVGQHQPLTSEALIGLLEDTVADHLMSEVPVGLFLSGGMDSSTIAALAARKGVSVSAFTVRFAGSSDDADCRAAALVARTLGLHHSELEVSVTPLSVLEAVAAHHDDPVGDVTCIPTFLMSRAASEHVRVVLTGEGADEAFAGYQKYRYLDRLQRLQRLPGSARALALGVSAASMDRRRRNKLRSWLKAEPGARSLLFDEVFSAEERAELFGTRAFEVSSLTPPEGLGCLESALWIDSGPPLSEQLNMKIDKMTMAHSVEARVPFLDHVVFETAAFLPESDKRDKAILRDAARALLPREIVGRRKRGFTVPIGHWLRADLRDLVNELLSPVRLRRQGVWDAGVVDRWRHEHQTGTVNRDRQMWNLLAVQLWWDLMKL
jgi:asparagine synthase (glutamine-hydrolysing)